MANPVVGNLPSHASTMFLTGQTHSLKKISTSMTPQTKVTAPNASREGREKALILKELARFEKMQNKMKSTNNTKWASPNLL